VPADVHGRSRWRKEGRVEDFLCRGLPNATSDVESVCIEGGGGGIDASRLWARRAQAEGRECVATSCHCSGCHGQDLANTANSCPL